MLTFLLFSVHDIDERNRRIGWVGDLVSGNEKEHGVERRLNIHFLICQSLNFFFTLQRCSLTCSGKWK